MSDVAIKDHLLESNVPITSPETAIEHAHAKSTNVQLDGQDVLMLCKTGGSFYTHSRSIGQVLDDLKQVRELIDAAVRMYDDADNNTFYLHDRFWNLTFENWEAMAVYQNCLPIAQLIASEWNDLSREEFYDAEDMLLDGLRDLQNCIDAIADVFRRMRLSMSHCEDWQKWSKEAASIVAKDHLEFAAYCKVRREEQWIRSPAREDSLATSAVAWATGDSSPLGS